MRKLHKDSTRVEDEECSHGWRSRRPSKKRQRNGGSGSQAWASMDLDMADLAYKTFLEELMAHTEGRGKEGFGKEVFEQVIHEIEKNFEEEEEDVQELDLDGFLQGKAAKSAPKLTRVIEEVEKEIVETRKDQVNDDDGEVFDPEYKIFWDGLKHEGFAHSVTFPTQNGNVHVLYEATPDENVPRKRKRGRPFKQANILQDSELNQKHKRAPQHYRLPNNRLTGLSKGSCLLKGVRNSLYPTNDNELVRGLRDVHVPLGGSKRKIQSCGRGKHSQDTLVGDEAYHKLVNGIKEINGFPVYFGANGKRLKYEASSSDSDERFSAHGRSRDYQRASGPATVSGRKKHGLMSDKVHREVPSFDLKERKGDAPRPRSHKNGSSSGPKQVQQTARVVWEKGSSSGPKQVRQTAPAVQERKRPTPVRSAYISEPSSPDIEEIKEVYVDSQKKFNSSLVRNHDQTTEEIACLTKKKKVKPIVEGSQHLRTTTPPPSEYRKLVTDILAKPFDRAEYVELFAVARERKPIYVHRETRLGGWQSVPDKRRRARSYLQTYRVLRKKIKEVLDDKPMVLMFLRGLFFWLQHRPMEGSFEPWLDKEWVAAMRKACGK